MYVMEYCFYLALNKCREYLKFKGLKLHKFVHMNVYSNKKKELTNKIKEINKDIKECKRVRDV